MRNVLFLAVAAGLMMGAPVPSAAQDAASHGFRSPSGNIHCNYFKDEDGESMRCDVRQVGNPQPPPPKDCELEFGKAFEISGEAALGVRVCHGDTVADDALTPLAYGEVWRRGAFTCKSEQAGVTCVNGKDHGFALSRNAQRLF